MNRNESLDLFIKFNRAYNSLQAAMKRKDVLPESLSETAFGVLEALHNKGPLCQNAIGRKILKSKGRVTQTIDSLEKQGLVNRTADPEDRRFITIALTDRGSELITRIFPLMQAAIEENLSVLNREEQIALANLCRKLGMSLEKDRPQHQGDTE